MAIFLLIVSAAGLGQAAVRGFLIPDRLERWLFALYLGFAATAVLVLAMGSVRLETAYWMLVVLAGAVVGFAARRRWTRREEARLRPPADARAPLTALEWGCAGAIALAMAFALLHALSPSTSWDAAVAHLALPKRYALEGRILLFEGNAYSAYPHLLHALYTMAYHDGGERGVQLLSWVLAGLACAAAFALGRRVAGRPAGWAAAAMLATAPVFMDQAGVASIDVPFLGFVLAALTVFLGWMHHERPPWLLLAGLLAGSACGVRHTAYLVCVLLGASALGLGGAHRLRAAATLAAGAVAGALPWLARSALVAGNPVYPFFDAFFAGGPPDPSITAIAAHESVQRADLIGLLRFPWDLVMAPDRMDGWSRSPGGLVLALGIPGAAWGGRGARWLGAYCLAGLVCFYFFRHSARYALPFLAPMMAVAGVMVTRPPALRPLAAMVLAVGLAFGLTLGAAAVHHKIPVALGLTSRAAYLEQRVERYPAFERLNASLPAGSKLLTFDMRSYYFDLPAYHNLEGVRTIIDLPLPDQLAWLRARGITHVLLPWAWLEETPGMAEVGLLQLARDWRASGRFGLYAAWELPRPRAGGTERVDVLTVPPAEGDGS